MRPDWHLLRHPVHLLALGLGTGLSPKAPGTVGTVLAVVLYLLVKDLSAMQYGVMLAGVTAISIWLCGWSARLLQTHDDPRIVLDEIAGYLLTMALVPPSGFTVIAGFILFRIFDIVKPWPIRWVDRRVHGGLGIVLDDLIAGLFALFFLHLAIWSAKWVG